MTQEFLNEEKLSFEGCTREQQHILLDAILDRNAEYYWIARDCWDQSGSRIPNLHTIYRTKPVKRLVIPWEHIKPEYRWAAMDECLDLWAYADKPKLLTDMWHGNAQQPLKALNIDTAGISWRDSLVERPDDK